MRILMVAGVVGATMALAPAPAEAGHGHTSFAFGLNLGVPCCYRPAYYAPAYYYPPPAYYYPPPVAYAPPPTYYAPAPTATVSNCRDYRGDATIDGNGTPFYGRACLGGDGRWHIVNQY
jgi:hypothetical protein